MKFPRDSHALKGAVLLVVIAAGFLWKRLQMAESG